MDGSYFPRDGARMVPPSHPDPVRALILQLAQERETTLSEMSRAIGKNHAYLQQFVHRSSPRNLPEESRLALAARYGLDPEVFRGSDTKSGQARRYPPKSLPPIPGEVLEMDARGGAGLGAGGMLVNAVDHNGRDVVARDVAVATWRLPSPYLSYVLRVREEDAKIVEVVGDSMAPTLLPGDRVIINTADQVPSPPGVFALWDGLGLVIKRVDHNDDGSDPPQLTISSDNPLHSSYRRTADEVRIIGRIVCLLARRM
ncbi:hypothetical protein STVA_41670 [Allostella vacuolata]|nr:hypothetical protein STVA_41670 [Stella vacuolata]